MRLLIAIALKHLTARPRQSVVSLLGIVLGVAFFLAISSLMQGSEKDFIRRLVDNSPHITIQDEFRNPRAQPVYQIYKTGAVELSSVKPVTETRGIRGYDGILAYLRGFKGLQASPVLVGQALINYAGKDMAVSVSGMIPEEIRTVSTIQNYMTEGSVDELTANPNGIIIGSELKRKLSLSFGDNITVSSTSGQRRVFKIVGIFHTGRSTYDEGQAFVTMKRMQALLNRPNRINSIIIKIPDPYAARRVAAEIEGRVGYKNVSWQEASEDILSTLAIRNVIMYTVVSAVLVVAAFGIYNVISTVVMEKHRDIAIMKSMGFRSGDIQQVFLVQGAVLGLMGCLAGLPLGAILMWALMQIKLKPPGTTEAIQMPIDWSVPQFLIAGAFAMLAALIAAYLPARKGAEVEPVAILRGSV